MGRERRGEKPAVRGLADTANGERGRRRARRGGGGGALFQGGLRVGSSQRQSRAELRGAIANQAGGPAGARRSAGGRGSSKGGQRRRALGRGLREPDTAAAAAAAGGAEGTPPLPAPCLRPSLLPRGPARTRLREGERWGASPERRPGARCVGPSSRCPCGLLAARGAGSRAGFGVTPPASLLGAAPPCALSTSGARLEAPGCAGVALVPWGSLPALRGGLWCLGPRGWGGEGSGVTRLLLPPPPPPPPPSGASFLRRGRPVTPVLLGRGRLTGRGGGGEKDAFSFPRCLPPG